MGVWAGEWNGMELGCCLDGFESINRSKVNGIDLVNYSQCPAHNKYYPCIVTHS